MKGGDGRRKRARKVKEKKACISFQREEDCSTKALERIDQPKKVWCRQTWP